MADTEDTETHYWRLESDATRDSWRAVCSCGWAGIYWPLKFCADNEGSFHLEEHTR